MQKIKNFGNKILGKKDDKTDQQTSQDPNANVQMTTVNQQNMNNPEGQYQGANAQNMNDPNMPQQNVVINDGNDTNVVQVAPNEGQGKKKKKFNLEPKDMVKKGEALFQAGANMYSKGKNFVVKHEQAIKMGKKAKLVYDTAKASVMGDYAGVVKNIVKANMGAIKREIKKRCPEAVKEYFRKSKEALNAWIRLQVEKAVIKILEKLKPVLKKALKQEGMWMCVQDLIDDIVDEIYPEIQEEILYQLRMKFGDPYIYEPPEKDTPCCFKPFVWLRGFYLYTTDPVDKNIWQKMKSFWWWFFILCSIFPYYGVQPFFYLIHFLMIHKDDEFQLITFILRFKRFQFLTQGVISGVIGYILYFACANVGDFTSNDDFQDCKEHGPGGSVIIYSDIPAFFLQFVLIWLSFFLLPCSQTKGRPKFRYVEMYKDDKEEEDGVFSRNCCGCKISSKRGGRLKCFMIYDLIAFILTLFIFFMVWFVGEADKEWQVKANFYFCKCMYGLLSIPFLIYAVPPMELLLTRSRATAYDSDGNCVPAADVKRVENPSEEEVREILQQGNFEELANDQATDDEDEYDIYDEENPLQQGQQPGAQSNNISVNNNSNFPSSAGPNNNNYVGQDNMGMNANYNMQGVQQ